MMDVLEDALKKPYPKPSKNPKTIVQPPLSFHLDVRQRIPTTEEFSELVYFTNAPVFTVFLKGTSSTSYKHHPTSATSLRGVLDDDPDAMRWPIVVNYDKQQIALDLSALRTILKTLAEDRKKQ
ncbi:hypothetical protein FIBSPDRAFT_1039907 [Athelia psychrophila]|uniref:Uncharacterized protein n=1 Tax=Athelia psychrophila TaxID=1759441 RepID=A0A166R584_9AGAM|nr:hypothetical protein FIBSPDRAFT_1039907 [Fibularhizoctonia sp. CBS 109695]